MSTYWTRLAMTRRRVVAATSAFAGAALLACSANSKRTGPSTGSSGQSEQGTPQNGGTLNTYLNRNFKLDPQQGSALDQQSIAGVMSRLFRYKTGLDASVTVDHVLENDLGLSAESPDALTWTVKVRPDAEFHNVPPVNGRTVEAETLEQRLSAPWILLSQP